LGQGLQRLFKVDTEARSTLDFEAVGQPVLLNAGEMQWIADNLFVGNKLTASEIRTSSGIRVDLRNIESRSSCCARGATTSRRRSRRWAGVTGLYGHQDEIVANGQTIVYTLHQTIGHLGIFVSGKVATKEHAGSPRAWNDRPDAARPLRGGDRRGRRKQQHRDRIHGKYLFRLGAHPGRHPRARRQQRQTTSVSPRSPPVGNQPRPLPHARQPAVQAMTTEQSAEMTRQIHPNRLHAMFSDKNPMMQPVRALAESVRGAQAGWRRQSTARARAGRLDLDRRGEATSRRATP
jgi:hypothetical protein